MSKYEHDAAVALRRMQMSTYEKPWYKSCAQALEKKALRGLKCLDLCCGNGEFSDILQDRFDMEVICADYIPLHLEQAKKKGFKTISINLDDDASTVQAIAEEFKDCFDIVVNLAAIEHVFNTGNLMGFAHTVLKPDGYFLINTPNIAFLAYLFFSLMGGRPFGEGHHIRFWNYRFLRTNLYLHGFSQFEDFRKFYSLPYDPVLRSCRNRKTIAKIITVLFHSCRLMQYLPFLKGLCTDELTVLSRKENVPVVGFELNEVSRNLALCLDEQTRHEMKERLRTAKRRGWLNEHLYLAKLVEELK